MNESVRTGSHDIKAQQNKKKAGGGSSGYW